MEFVKNVLMAMDLLNLIHQEIVGNAIKIVNQILIVMLREQTNVILEIVKRVLLVIHKINVYPVHKMKILLVVFVLSKIKI